MLHGDLGVSYNISKNTPIAQLLQTRLPTSLRIGGQSVLLGAVVGLLLGIVAALKHNSIWDTLCTVVSVLGVSVPSYVFALFLAYTCGFQLGWFPQLYQINHPFISSVLPSVALSMFTIASIARFTRSEMLEVLDSDYLLLAASKGLSQRALITRHTLRNALIPIITVLAPPDRQPDDGFSCGGKDLLDSRHRFADGAGHPVQRLQRDDCAGVCVFGHVCRHYAGG